MEQPFFEKRMYFLVLYSLSAMQKGIQAGHAALEYAYLYGDIPFYVDFIKNHKTWIVLDGGTSNSQIDDKINVPQGTLNQIERELLIRNIRFASFREPDLENALTAVCFIADERVWNYEDFPNFNDIIDGNDTDLQNIVSNYDRWVNLMGGETSVYLRELLKNKRTSN